MVNKKKQDAESPRSQGTDRSYHFPQIRTARSPRKDTFGAWGDFEEMYHLFLAGTCSDDYF